MVKKIKFIPKGCHTVNPYLVVKNGAQAVAFYKAVFDAEESFHKDRPNGSLMHSELKIGDSIIMLADECDEPHPGHEYCCLSPETLKGSSVNLFIYVKNVDDVFKKAVAAGAKAVTPVSDMFWGDRVGQIKDPSGHLWSISTHIEDVSPQEMEERIKKLYNEANKAK